MTSFETVYVINVNEKIEKKNNLSYLSWAWAWAEFVKAFPKATYEVIKDKNGMPYFKDESGAFVYTKVDNGELTHEMWLPVMDNRNKSIKIPDSMDINKTLMRCLTKNLAMFGLGLYIYAGEDLPEASKEAQEQELQNRVLEIEALIIESNSDKQKFLSFFKVKTIEELPYEDAVNALKSKIEKANNGTN